jgi:hypothetical protein
LADAAGRVEEASGSFLKKRTKKLLSIQEIFCFFFIKKKRFLGVFTP